MADWTPAALSSVLAWYAADLGVTDTAGAVTGWADQSPNGHDLTQGSASLRPSTGADTLGGINLITFDGDRLEPAANVTGVKACLFVFTEANGSDASDNVCPVHGVLTTAGTDHTFIRTNQEDYDLSIDGSNANSGNASNTDLTLTAGGNIDLGIPTSPIPTGTFIFYADYDSAVAFDAIGGFDTGSTVYNTRLKLGEIVFLDAVPSEADRQRIEGYLAHKWSQTSLLPSAHPYKTTAPQLAAASTSQPTVPATFTVATAGARIVNTSGVLASGEITARYVGGVFPDADNGDSVTFTPGGSLSISNLNLDNPGDNDTVFEDGLVLDEATDITTASVNDPGGDRVAVFAYAGDDWFGVPIEACSGVRCGPRICVFNGDRYHVELTGPPSRVVISKNGRPWALLPVLPADTDRNDFRGYHNGATIEPFDATRLIVDQSSTTASSTRWSAPRPATSRRAAGRSGDRTPRTARAPTSRAPATARARSTCSAA